MDKLDKVPPKDVATFKDRPITHGIISNAIFQVAWSGVAAVIAWLVGHLALIRGIPLYLAIFMGAIVFFLIALSYNLVTRRRDPRALSPATVEPQIESEREAIDRLGDQNDQLQGELHLAEKEIATLKGEKGRLNREKENLTKNLSVEKKQHESLKKSVEISRREVAEVRAEAKAQQDTYQLEREGLLNERKDINEKVLEVQKVADETKKRLNEEVNQRNNWMNSYYEASRKLAEFQYVVKIIEDQKEALQKHVVILRDFKVRVDLIDTRFGPPRIRFGFKIRNEALPNITIFTVHRGDGARSAVARD